MTRRSVDHPRSENRGRPAGGGNLSVSQDACKAQFLKNSGAISPFAAECERESDPGSIPELLASVSFPSHRGTDRQSALGASRVAFRHWQYRAQQRFQTKFSATAIVSGCRRNCRCAKPGKGLFGRIPAGRQVGIAAFPFGTRGGRPTPNSLSRYLTLEFWTALQRMFQTFKRLDASMTTAIRPNSVQGKFSRFGNFSGALRLLQPMEPLLDLGLARMKRPISRNYGSTKCCRWRTLATGSRLPEYRCRAGCR